jgi:hypothetical protein
MSGETLAPEIGWLLPVTAYTIGQQAYRSIIHALLTIVGMSGIAGLLLPFTFGVSPVHADVVKS